MKASEWKAFLATWTRALAERKSDNPNARRAIDPQYGLGFPGATEEEIAAAEERLRVSLPPSYREFLKATNGLQQPYTYVPACGGDFWPVEQIDWFAARNSEWIAAYDDAEEPSPRPGQLRFADELRGTLELSHDGDAAVYLLNPRVVGTDGEWEAWFFATWSPDVERFRSFDELMRARYRQFLDGPVDGF